MAFFTAELLDTGFSLAIAVLFIGTLVYLARLNQRLGALRGAQSELHGLLRACSDNVDSAERSIAALRGAAQSMATDLGRSLEQAERLKADIDGTCAAASRLLARLAEEPAVREMRAAPAEAAAAEPPKRRPIAQLADPAPEPEAAEPPAGADAPVEPRWTGRVRPAVPQPAALPEAAGERAALRLFRDTIRAL